MIDLGAYKDKFSESGQRILEHALGESRRRDQNYVSIEHILNALTSEESVMFNATMRDLSVDPHALKGAKSSKPQIFSPLFRKTKEVSSLKCCAVSARTRRPSWKMSAPAFTS